MITISCFQQDVYLNFPVLLNCIVQFIAINCRGLCLNDMKDIRYTCRRFERMLSPCQEH